MDNLEKFMNNLTDMDLGWWPLLILRPQKNKDITNLILFKLTLLFGPLLGLIIWLYGFLMLHATSWGHAVVSLLLGSILFFLIYKFTFAYFWNRRAKRLRKNSL